MRRIRKPVLAAVAGYALGGGCDLEMMCDNVIAAESAKFEQPEGKLGILPGAGGTQALLPAVGKAKAMDLCLTGRTMDAVEAERAGLVSRLVPLERYLENALEVAASIAAYSLPSIRTIKESINRTYEISWTGYSLNADGVIRDLRARIRRRGCLPSWKNVLPHF